MAEQKRHSGNGADLRDLLGKHVTVWPAFDHRKQHAPMGAGEVVGIYETPVLVVRHPDGSTGHYTANAPRETRDLGADHG